MMPATLPAPAPGPALTARLLQAADPHGAQHAAPAELLAVKEGHLAAAAGGGLREGAGGKKECPMVGRATPGAQVGGQRGPHCQAASSGPLQRAPRSWRLRTARQTAAARCPDAPAPCRHDPRRASKHFMHARVHACPNQVCMHAPTRQQAAIRLEGCGGDGCARLVAAAHHAAAALRARRV